MYVELCNYYKFNIIEFIQQLFILFDYDKHINICSYLILDLFLNFSFTFYNS